MDEATRTDLEIVIADVDSFVCRVAARALTDAGFSARVAHDVVSTRTLIEGSKLPLVLVIDWTFCSVEAAELCRNLKKQRRVHVIALIAGGRPRDVAAAIESGADECLSKPLSTHELVSRVCWVARMFTALPPLSTSLREALARAARGTTGEVVVSQGETVGRIWFESGEIVWAVLSGRQHSLRTILEGTTTLEPDVVQEVTLEAKRTERNVLEVLVEWGLASRDDVVSSVRRYLREVVRAMFLLPESQVVFAPAMRRGGWSGPRFALADILPPETRRDLPRLLPIAKPSNDDEAHGCEFARSCHTCADLGRKLEGELRLSGADAVAIVHGPTGETIAHSGDGLDPDMVRSKVKIMAILAESDRAEEIVVSAGKKYYLLSATSCPDAFIVMTATRKKIGLGALKLEVGRIAAQLYPDEEATSQRLERERKSHVPPKPPGARDPARSRAGD